MVTYSAILLVGLLVGFIAGYAIQSHRVTLLKNEVAVLKQEVDSCMKLLNTM